MIEIEHLRCPADIRPGDPVRKHVHQPRRAALVLIGLVARQPRGQPEGVFQQHVCACTIQVGMGAGRRIAPQCTGATEHLAPPTHQPGAVGLLGRTKIGQHRHRALVARLDPLQPRHVEREITAHTLLGRGRFHRGIEHHQQVIERMLERRGGQILLALEIIGHAGGVQPHAPRDIGEGHALRALFVDRLCRRSQDGVPLCAKPLRPGFTAFDRADRCPRLVHPCTLTASFRRNSVISVPSHRSKKGRIWVGPALYRKVGTV